MSDLIVDFNTVSLIIDFDRHDLYVPILTPAMAGSQGPRGDDGWKVPIQIITTDGPELTLDYELGKHIVVHLEHDITALDVIGWPPAGFLARMTIEFHNPDDHTLLWSPDVVWSEGVDPTITENECWRALTTTTGGARVNGHVIGNNFPL